jgi:hypothetical protein
MDNNIFDDLLRIRQTMWVDETKVRKHSTNEEGKKRTSKGGFSPISI